MNLSADRFYKGCFNFRRNEGDPLETISQYSYETSGKTGKLFDLLVLDGKEYVRTNMGQWSNLISDWTPIHYEIRHHFNLGG